MKFLVKVVSLFVLLAGHECLSQIGAEAQGGQLSLWAAIGLDQELSKKWLSITDIGYGRHSDPNDVLLLKRQGLNVLTQDFVFKMNEHWHFAFSFGYWRRNAYDEKAPFDARLTPYSFRNEIRPFQRIYYRHRLGGIRISHGLRADYRFYYNEDFSGTWTTPFEFRARYIQAWRIPLTKDGLNWFIVNDEVLTAIDRYSGTVTALTGTNWSPYQITENRFSLYYRRSIKERTIDLDIGIMHQYWRDKPGLNTFNLSYNLMFDIIIRNPFKRKEEKEEE